MRKFWNGGSGRTQGIGHGESLPIRSIVLVFSNLATLYRNILTYKMIKQIEWSFCHDRENSKAIKDAEDNFLLLVYAAWSTVPQDRTV